MTQTDSWQLWFFVFAALIVAWQALRGWQLGIARVLLNIFALAIAYAIAFWCRGIAAPWLRPLGYPDFVNSAMGGSVLGSIVFLVIWAAGKIVLRRTSQQNSAILRFGYGATGAVAGAAFGLALIWFTAIAIRLTGTLAENEVALASQPLAVAAHDWTPRIKAAPPSPFVHSLAGLKRSLDEGSVGAVIQRVDPVPVDVYGIIGKIGRIIADPACIERFLDYPGAKTLAEHPKIIALRDDPAVEKEVAAHNYFGLLGNRRFADALNDPQLMELVEKFPLEKALDYALKD
jgi:hypothetical protein